MSEEINIIRYGLTLSVICLITASALSIVYATTKPKIDENRDAEIWKSLKAVLPAGEEFREESTGKRPYYRALAGGKTVGYAFIVRGEGYSSTIETLVGVDPKGKITGVRVVSQQETPGLGARITEVKPGEESPWFTRQFKGKRFNQLGLRTEGGEIDAITGATVSSAAVAESVEKGVSEFMEKIEDER